MTTTPLPRLPPQTCLLSSAFSACKMIWWRHIRSKWAAEGWGHDPSSRSSWFRAVCAAPWRPPPSPLSACSRHPVRLHNIIFHIVRSLACHFLHYATVSSPLAKQGDLVQVLARSLKASPIPSTIFKRCSIPRPALSICALKFVFNFWLSTFLFFWSPALPPHCPHCPAPHFNFNCHSRALKS